MRGVGGLIGIVAGLIVLALSVFWPENTFLAILLLTSGALSCSWEGVNANDTTTGTRWTGTGVVAAAFVCPFFTVFGAPVSVLFTVPVGLLVVGMAVLADRYAGGKERSVTLGSRSNWPLLAGIMGAGTLTALLIRALQ